MISIFIVCLDGCIQFIFGKNLIGYEKYRIDRISGFFKDDLVLGSYLSRIFPVLVGISLYFKFSSNFSEIDRDFAKIDLYKLALIEIIFNG